MKEKNVQDVEPAQTNISKLVSQIDNSPNRNGLRLFLELFTIKMSENQQENSVKSEY